MRRYKTYHMDRLFHVVRKNLDFFFLENVTINQTLHPRSRILLQDVMIFIFEKDINVTKARFVCDRQFEACQVFVNSDLEGKPSPELGTFSRRRCNSVVSRFYFVQKSYQCRVNF